jgi:hypothetical protein
VRISSFCGLHAGCSVCMRSARGLTRVSAAVVPTGATAVIFQLHMMTLQDSEPDDPTNATKMQVPWGVGTCHYRPT